jgi:hypothetical protein
MGTPKYVEPEREYYNVTIQWNDKSIPTENMVFSSPVGTEETENDEDIFFYVNSEESLKNMINKEGVDFKVLSYTNLEYNTGKNP